MQPSTSSLISRLPTELLIQVLNHFPTRQLLVLATVDRHFYDLVGSLHYSRLLEASRLDEHVMVLECYHPSVKISTPTLRCEYIGTDGIVEAEKNIDLVSLKNLYSRFRPSGTPNVARGPPPIAGRNIYGGPSDSTGLSHDLYLDSGEPFSQLCTQASIIKVDPERGLFLSISSITEGVIRVWRQWLRTQSQLADLAVHKPSESIPPKGPAPAHSVILWTDVLTENVGLKFRVVEKQVGNAPLLCGPDDEPPVAYTLQYEELLVRTNALLLSLERSLTQQVTHAVQMEDFLGSGRHRQQYLLDTYYRSEKPRQHEDAPVDGLIGSNAERMWKAANGFVRRAEQGLLKGVINLSAAIDTLLSGVER